jgi:thioredoxin 1
MAKKVCRPVRQLSLLEAIQKLKTSMKPTIVQFRASWCGACQAATPEVEKAACDLQDDIETVAIDIDENPMIAREFGIAEIPTVAVIQQGQIKAKLAEATSAKKYKKMANDWLKANGYKK